MAESMPHPAQQASARNTKHKLEFSWHTKQPLLGTLPPSDQWSNVAMLAALV
jgi:hypothetical protein